MREEDDGVQVVARLLHALPAHPSHKDKRVKEENQTVAGGDQQENVLTVSHVPPAATTPRARRWPRPEKMN